MLNLFNFFNIIVVNKFFLKVKDSQTAGWGFKKKLKNA